MGQLTHALIWRLQAAEQIIEVSCLEVRGLIEKSSSFVDLPLLDFDLPPTKELPDQ